MRRLLFDVEANGFLEEATRLHVLAIRDADTKELVGVWNPMTGFDEGLGLLVEADLVIGHNIIRYDLPLLTKLYGIEIPKHKVHDTYVSARLAFPDIGQWDVKIPDLPKDLFKKHSLKAWGYRLKNPKDEYTGGFEEWNQEQQDYCVQDTSTNVDLFQFLEPKLEGMEEALTLEHDVQRLMFQVELNGWPFNFAKAVELQGKLSALREEARQALVDTFGTWVEPVAIEKIKDDQGNLIKIEYTFTPKTSNRKRGVTAGDPYCKLEYVTFNPGSRHHIARCLKQRHGWEPKVFTESGQAKIDDEIIAGLDFPEAPIIGRFLMLEKRLSQLAEGEKAWLNYYNHKTGKIHGAYNTIGTNTTRAAHHSPNIGQVPSNDAEFGPECRELFYIPEGWVGVGTDMKSLEDVCLAHFCHHFDKGFYANILQTEDSHWWTAQKLGLVPPGTKRDKNNHALEKQRGRAKTFKYQLVYGGGNDLLGSIIGGGFKEGLKLKKLFFKSIPAMGLLDAACKEAAVKGYLRAIDGTKLPVRSLHSVLNLLLQGTGARLCKAWIVETNRRLVEEHGLKHGWDGDYVLLGWIHDEQQFAARNKEIAELIGRVSVEVARSLNDRFKFRCFLDADFKFGMNWKETH